MGEATWYKERVIEQPKLPSEQRWEASSPAPKIAGIHVDQGPTVTRLVNTTDGRNKRLTSYESSAKPAAYFVDNNQKKMAVLLDHGGFDLYNLHKNEFIGSTRPRDKGKLSFAATAPAVATAVLGATMGHQHLASAQVGHAVLGVGLVMGVVTLARTAKQYVEKRQAAKERVKEVVVQQTVAFSVDGTTFDRVVPGGVLRYSFKEKKEFFVRSKTAQETKDMAPRLRASAKRDTEATDKTRATKAK